MLIQFSKKNKCW